MVALTELFSDYDLYEVTQDPDVDLTLLETEVSNDSPFSVNDDYFDSLQNLEPTPAFVPSLHETVFEEPLKHALWTPNLWPEPERHFPA